MDTIVTDDAVVRENRRSGLARRLISHGVRTRTISGLTGLSRSRLATLRRRLMVPEDSRRRGPPRSSLDVFLRNPRARTEGAALAALCAVFNSPIAGFPAGVPEQLTALDRCEQLCEIYEAYRACYPRSQVQLEEMILLRKSLADAYVIELGKCRRCRALILIHRFDASQRTCWQCDLLAEREGITPKASPEVDTSAETDVG
jgi:hypothetical protein